jgi:hypothetical protein
VGRALVGCPESAKPEEIEELAMPQPVSSEARIAGISTRYMEHSRRRDIL